jgi:hypothetical protein
MYEGYSLGVTYGSQQYQRYGSSFADGRHFTKGQVYFIAKDEYSPMPKMNAVHCSLTFMGEVHRKG